MTENQMGKSAAAVLLAGGGEMGQRTRDFDWSQTSVGPLQAWPLSLKTVVRTMLDSRYAMWIGWGPDFTFFYNDAYAKMTLGPKHPWALGRPARDVWPEIWDEISGRAESVLRTGQATWDEGLLLFLERRGFTEESYHTFSYSPVPDDSGGIGGMLCVVTEDTERTIGERRLRTLRELAATAANEARSAEDACRTAARVLAGNPQDVPFGLLYLLDAAGGRAVLAGVTNVELNTSISPNVIELDNPVGPWPLAAVAESGKSFVVKPSFEQFGALPGGAWPEPAQQAVVLPLAKPGQTQLAGFAIVGINPRRPFDDAYRGFVDLLAGQIASAIASARAYEEERRRAESLAELDRAKTAFFSNVSHEFRTPLTLILSPLEEILAKPAAEVLPENRQLLEVMHRNGQRLQRLVNTLLDFSRIEAGRVQANYQPTDLATYTAELASNFRSAAEKAGLQLKVDCPPLTETVFVDHPMWEKVILNLLSNAFKFTFDGEIAVTLRQIDRAAVVQIRDTGTGIPAHEMPKLFERFHRVENARGRTHEGSGIGLALVQELVKQHGGTITAESEVGLGTTFTISLPLGHAHLPQDQVTRNVSTVATHGTNAYVEEALRWLPDQRIGGSNGEQKPTATSLSRQTTDDSSRPRLLVADDNADMRQYIVRLLQSDYDVEAVTDGEAALAAVHRQLPDLILSDVMMPKLDGFGLLAALRGDRRTVNVPVILLSARAGLESRVEGLQAGADDYLVKPFGAAELVARVQSHLQIASLRQKAQRDLAQRQRQLQLVADHAPVMICHCDRELRYQFVNKSYAERFGLHPRDVIGKHLPEIVGQRAYDAFRQHVDATLTGRVVEFEMEVPFAAGSQFVRAAYTPEWQEGQVVGFIAAIINITERKRAELREQRLAQAAATANVKFRAFFDQGPLFAGIMALDGTLREANQLSLDACGFTREQVLGKKFWDCPWWSPSPEIRQIILDGSQRAAAGESFRREMPYFVADGSQRMVDFILMPIKDETGQVVFLAPTGTDITERKLAEGKLRKNEERMRLLWEAAAVLLTTDDPDTMLHKLFAKIGPHMRLDVYFNFMVNETATGLRLASCTGVSEAIARAIEELEFGQAICGTVALQRRPIVANFIQQSADPKAQLVKSFGIRTYACSPLLAGDQLLGTLSFASRSRDEFDVEELDFLQTICHYVTAAYERLRLIKQLREADRRKDEFLATLAHELRNPLAPLRNGLQVLQLDSVDGEMATEARAMMERQLSQMVHLIDDLLDLSRISRGKIELRRQRIELAKIVQQGIETSRPTIELAGHELMIQMPTTPIYVDADLTRLAQVFSNLLNNAAKYTERGGRIRMSVERVGHDAVVSVRDNGIGIPPHMLPRVFDMFTQVDRNLERAQGGLGIGLSIVKRLVEMHGGSVEARSDGNGLGSEFTVRLPLALSVLQPPGANTERPHALNRRRILVVDDNRDSALSLAMMLKLMGNETKTAHDGYDALEVAAAFRPELILLDIGMPRLNGYDTAREIRKQAWGQSMYLVALTGWGQEDDRRQSQAAGFDNHLVKPIDHATLEKLLAELKADSA